MGWERERCGRGGPVPSLRGVPAAALPAIFLEKFWSKPSLRFAWCVLGKKMCSSKLFTMTSTLQQHQCYDLSRIIEGSAIWP